MKSDYQLLNEKYNYVLLENTELKEKNKILECKNKRIDVLMEENEILENEVFDLRLLLHKKTRKYAEVLLNARK